jgi:hypothetical protein
MKMPIEIPTVDGAVYVRLYGRGGGMIFFDLLGRFLNEDIGLEAVRGWVRELFGGVLPSRSKSGHCKAGGNTSAAHFIVPASFSPDEIVAQAHRLAIILGDPDNREPFACGWQMVGRGGLVKATE